MTAASDQAVRTETGSSRSEHNPGGMLNGAEVIVHTCNGHGTRTHRGWVREFTSVPAPHLVMDVVEGSSVPRKVQRRLIFCNVIDWIEPAP